MKKEITVEFLMKPFAKILASSVPAYLKQIEQLKNSPHEKAMTRELRHCIKWVVKHSGPLFPPKASAAALKLADGKVDLFALQYKDQLKAEEVIQGKKVAKRGDGWLYHEHKIPVEETLISTLQTKGVEKDVLDNLLNQEIVWITREENSKLPHRNRGNHDEAYGNAGIAIHPNPYGACWLEKPWQISTQH